MHVLDDYLKFYKLKQNDVVIDLGAAHGEFEHSYMKQILETNSTIYMIEGFEDSCNKLRKDLMNRPNFKLINALIGATDGEAEFVVTTQPYCNYKKTANQDISRWDQKEVTTKMMPAMRLDTLLNITGPVGFIKCDIEGSEIEAFLNCTKWDMVQSLAIGAYHVVDGQPTYVVLKPYFESLGFDVIHEPNPKGHDMHNEDLLYVNRK